MAGKNNDKGSVKDILWPVFGLFKWFFASLAIVFLSVLVMCFYLWRFVPPAQHQAHLDRIQDFYVTSAIASERADTFGKGAYQLLLVESGIERLSIRKTQPHSNTGKYQVWREVFNFVADVWDVVRKTVYIFGAKLSSLLSALPLLALFAFAAIGDGLVARYVRREEGGNESATRYHLWKTIGHSWLPMIMALTFLLCPIAIEPLWFILPTALVTIIGLRSQTKYFKKYL